MNLTDLHRRLLDDVLDIGATYGFVITGGYLDVATQSPAQMEAISAALADQLGARGWQVTKIEADPLSARMMVIAPSTKESCEVDVLKEAFYHPPETTKYGPVLALEDVIGTKVRALADRGAARDLIDVRAASTLYSIADLESLGRRHARDEFLLEDLAARLDGAEWFDDEAFTAYDLTEDDVSNLQAKAREIRGKRHSRTGTV